MDVGRGAIRRIDIALASKTVGSCSIAATYSRSDEAYTMSPPATKPIDDGPTGILWVDRQNRQSREYVLTDVGVQHIGAIDERRRNSVTRSGR